MIVGIFQLGREFDWWTWLCPTCLDGWLGRGWQIRTRKPAPHSDLICDDCEQKGDTDG